MSQHQTQITVNDASETRIVGAETPVDQPENPDQSDRPAKKGGA